MSSESPLAWDGFEKVEDYTNDVPIAFYVVVIAYVAVSLCLVIPLHFLNRPKKAVSPEVTVAHSDSVPTTTNDEAELPAQEMVELSRLSAKPADTDLAPKVQNGGEDGTLLPDVRKNALVPESSSAQHIPTEALIPMTEFSPGKILPATDVAERLSAVPSAATTSRIVQSSPRGRNTRIRSRKMSVRAVDISSRMRWNHDQPLRPADAMQRSVRLERQSEMSEAASQTSRRSRASRASRSGTRQMSSWSLSDAASCVLDEELVEGEAEFYRQRYLQRAANRIRRPSTSDISLMPPLSPDDLAPEDAADAHDVGRVNRPEDFETPNQLIDFVFGWCGCVLDIAEADYEIRRILTLAVPSTIGAVAEPLFRLVLAAIISHFIDTNSMVAYVFVLLFVRLTTEELSGAISDAESTMVQFALGQGGDRGFFEAGQCVQLAIMMQVIVGVPVMLIWVFVMEDVVDWLVRSDTIAKIASGYTGVIIVDYILRGVCRTFMLPFHLSGLAHFEATIDLCATLLTVIAIAIITSSAPDGEPSLKKIGWIQVIIGIAKTFIKVAYVITKGWLEPYRRGLFGAFSLFNGHIISSFLLHVFPLCVGSVIELGEWEFLVLFVRHLGGPQVVAWAIMGILWEVFVALTEGLGQAAAVRVSYCLSQGLGAEARTLSNKIIFLASVSAFAITSVFLMFGPNFATALTKDTHLENLLNKLVGLTGLANVAMSFAQIYWSLTGAQNRFGLASCAILVCRWLIIIPFAAVCIYGYYLDVWSVAGAVAVGYATAAFALSWFVMRSDWSKLAQEAQENVSPADELDSESEDSSDMESSTML